MPTDVNLLTFGGTGFVEATDANKANTGAIRGANGELNSSVHVAGASLPAALNGGTGVVNGGFSYQAYQTLTGNTTLNAQSPKINYLDPTSAAFTVTLPLAATSDQQEFEFYMLNAAHNVTIQGNGSETIQLGASTANTQTMTTAGQKLGCRRGASSIWRAA